METIAFRMTLKPGMRDEYERRHREIWPELVEAIGRFTSFPINASL